MVEGNLLGKNKFSCITEYKTALMLSIVLFRMDIWERGRRKRIRIRRVCRWYLNKPCSRNDKIKIGTPRCMRGRSFFGTGFFFGKTVLHMWVWIKSDVCPESGTAVSCRKHIDYIQIGFTGIAIDNPLDIITVISGYLFNFWTVENSRFFVRKEYVI